MGTSHQGNELFFGIFLLREVSQEQSFDIRGQERILLRHTAVRHDGIGNRRMGFFLGHLDLQEHRFLLQGRTQADLELHQSGNESLSVRQVKTPRKLRFRAKERYKEEETYVYPCIRVLVDRRWEEKEISRFASLLELRI